MNSKKGGKLHVFWLEGLFECMLASKTSEGQGMEEVPFSFVFAPSRESAPRAS